MTFLFNNKNEEDIQWFFSGHLKIDYANFPRNIPLSDCTFRLANLCSTNLFKIIFFLPLSNIKKTISCCLLPLFLPPSLSSSSVIEIFYCTTRIRWKITPTTTIFIMCRKKYSHIFAICREELTKADAVVFFCLVDKNSPPFSLLTYELCHFKSWTHTLLFLFSFYFFSWIWTITIF